MAALAVVCLAHPAYPIDPNRMLSQYVRNHWGVEQGFTAGSVTSFAQTPDGYLWIGTEKGLIRFDGLTFRLFQQASPTTFPIGAVQGLMTDAQGNLWIRLQSTKILRYHDGKFELGREEAEFGITSFGRRGDGTVLFSSLTLGVLTHRAGRFEILTSPADRAPSEGTATTEIDNRSTRLSWATQLAPHRFAEPNSVVISMAESTDGKVWLGTRDKGLFYMSEGRVFAVGKGQFNSRINSLLALENRELWVGTDRGIVRWNGAEVTMAGVSSSLRHIQVLSMIRDHDSNIWVGTAGGLIRVNGEGVSVDGGSPRRSGAVTALFEDREGNVWVGRPSGIERLRDSAFVTYSVADGLPSDRNGPVYVDAEGRTWFAPLEGGLYWTKGGQRGRVTEAGLGRDVVYSISGRQNELWVGRQRGGLTVLRTSGASFAAKTFTQADGLAQNSVYAVHQSRDGTVWAGTLGGGISAFRNGVFSTYTTANGMSSNMVTSIAESPDGTVWVATSNGLSAFSNGRWHVFTVRDGLPSADLNCLLVDSTGVLWVGSTAGIALLSSDHVQVPLDLPEALREPIFGIAEDRNGWLWIATSNHVLRVKRDQLLRSGYSGGDARAYGAADGLLGTEGVKRHQSVVADTLGRIWLSMNRGLSVVDPNRSAGNSGPALVHVDTVTVDGSAVDSQLPIHISSARQRITFDYAGLSLSNSERVRYRYRLDGFDQDWSEPTTIRTAIYTNLKPGSYRFRVLASNSDGLWNGSEGGVALSVAPTLSQTWWFRLGLVLCAGVVSLALYRVRMHQLTRVLNARFEERLAERTRIAQDLHDTLLQGVLSASMQLHVGVDQLPDDSPARATLNRVVNLMGRVIDEGRNTLRGLRSSIESSQDLTASFSRVPQEIGMQEGVDFRVVVEGASLPLRSVIRDDVYSIGREALVNAFRHSRASSVEVELEYAPTLLTIVIRDNGCGIDPEMLKSGRDGHWGLSGMRERADRIGARVKVMSRPGNGTEVELRVPGNIAFESNASRGASKWFGRRNQRRAEKNDQAQKQRAG